MASASTAAPALEERPRSSRNVSSEPKDAAARRLSSSPSRMARSRALFCNAGISDLRGFQGASRLGVRGGLGLRGRRGAIGVAALDRHHRGDRMLENQLLLIVGFEHQRVLIETLDASGKFDTADQVNRNDAFFLARVVQKRILYILRRFVHRALFNHGGNLAYPKNGTSIVHPGSSPRHA